MTTFWWTCPLCFDIMERTPWESAAAFDRDEHLRRRHNLVPEGSPYRTRPSFWNEKEHW